LIEPTSNWKGAGESPAKTLRMLSDLFMPRRASVLTRALAPALTVLLGAVLGPVSGAAAALTTDAALATTVSELQALPVVRAVASVMRVEGEEDQ